MNPFKELTVRKVLVLVVLMSLVVASGCGIMMNATYSQILDKTVALSAETASRAEHGNLTLDEAKAALVMQAKTWKLFQDARDGKSPTTATPPASQ